MHLRIWVCLEICWHFKWDEIRAWWKGLPAVHREKGSRRCRPSTRQLFSRSTSTRQLFFIVWRGRWPSTLSKQKSCIFKLWKNEIFFLFFKILSFNHEKCICDNLLVIKYKVNFLEIEQEFWPPYWHISWPIVS